MKRHLKDYSEPREHSSQKNRTTGMPCERITEEGMILNRRFDGPSMSVGSASIGGLCEAINVAIPKQVMVGRHHEDYSGPCENSLQKNRKTGRLSERITQWLSEAENLDILE